jgi:hypothetical protein
LFNEAKMPEIPGINLTSRGQIQAISGRNILRELGHAA